MIENIIIPKYLQGSLKHTSKTKIKKANPSEYSLTFIKNGWVCHYTSEFPSYAYGHAWLDAVNENYTPPDSWCLIQELEPGQLYFVWVKNGIVEAAKKCTSNSIDAMAMKRVEKVYLCGSDIDFIKSIVSDIEIQIVPNMSDDDLKEFALKSSKKINPRVVVMLTLILVAGLGFALYQFSSSENKMIRVEVIDPFAEYKDIVKQSFSASVVLDNAVNLAAYAALVPDGWEFKGVYLQNNKVSLSVDRQVHGLRISMVKWLASHNALKTRGHIDNKATVIDVPIQRGLNGWGEKIHAIDDLTNKIKDIAVVQGWVVDNHIETQKGNFKLQELTLLNSDLTLSELSTLSRLLAPFPVAIKTLNLKSKTLVGVVNAYLIIEFIGVS